MVNRVSKVVAELIYIFFHCVRRISRSATTLDPQMVKNNSLRFLTFGIKRKVENVKLETKTLRGPTINDVDPLF